MRRAYLPRHHTIMHLVRTLVAGVLLVGSLAFAQSPADDDHDGLSDAVESMLLAQFRPTFMVSQDDCDSLPAEIVPGKPDPSVFARDGAIYGQATPNGAGDVELHYFHLWSRDCGRRGHFGDVEHVSALVHKLGGTWQARYWYAAAHEDTVCDRSMAVRANDLDAAASGPTVWISAGKHASYFSRKLCPG